MPQQTLHDHEHRHALDHPHALGRTVEVRHTHGHRHTGFLAARNTVAPFHRPHSHTEAEQLDLARQRDR